MNFRQVHLDFHTSGLISGIGSAFDKKEFQETLQEAAVNSITCFSLCHHGYSYHPTKIGTMHPGLVFNLLRAQIDACHEVGIKVPVYISAGFNEVIAASHPQWREVGGDWTSSDLQPGFKKLCFNSGYLDFLCAIIEETVELFPDGDGIFLDIICQNECCCPKCVHDMLEQGYNPQFKEDRHAFSEKVLLNYYQRTTAAARKYDLSMRIFHNSGHVSAAHPELLDYFSHLELESLPTGGWGYDHFPQTAAFARTTGLEFLGMTGKFHTTWGEFGGLKHPNALRYECAAMIADGARCSIGDQLHPTGKIDKSTYAIIGAAYREIREKEPFCEYAKNVSDIALLNCESTGGARGDGGDTGATRILLEGQFLFDIATPKTDFKNYKMVIVADHATIEPSLAEKLNAFVKNGGKLLLMNGQAINGLDCGATIGKKSIFNPTYALPASHLRPEFLSTPFVVYSGYTELTPTTGETLGALYNPYFNREYNHFCSHQHTPNCPEPTPFAFGVKKENLVTMAQPLFSIYAKYGNAVLRKVLEKIIAELLDEDISVRTNLPSLARLRFTRDEVNHRNIVHLLYGNTVKRGEGVEIIEELLPMTEVDVAVKVAAPVESVTLEPSHQQIPFLYSEGRLHFHIPKFICHQMIALNWKEEK